MPFGSYDDVTSLGGTDSFLVKQGSSTKEVTGTIARNYFADALNAKTDFGASGNDSADDTAELQAAATAAYSEKRPLYIPHGTYRVSAALDWRGKGLRIFGGGWGWPDTDRTTTVIKQMTSNTPILKVGPWYQHISDMFLTYDTPPTSAHTSANAIELYKANWCVLERIQMRNVGRGIMIPQTDYDDGFTSTGNGCSSCEFNSLIITGFATNAISMQNYLGGWTGSIWNNIYITNNPSGTRLNPAGPIVVFKINDEVVFNQLNIEHALLQTAEAIYLESGGNFIVNGLHLEQLSLEASGKSLIFESDGPNVIINGLCMSNNQVTNAGTHSLLGHFTTGSVRVNGFYQHDNTVAGTFAMDNANNATGGACTVEFDGDTSLFTTVVANEKTAPLQVVTRVGENRYRWKQNGKNVTTGTAAPVAGTWTQGDTVWNTSPSAAGAPGWVCTTGGTPGTWKAMASLAS